MAKHILHYKKNRRIQKIRKDKNLYNGWWLYIILNTFETKINIDDS